jgi:hypothetical protein
MMARKKLEPADGEMRHIMVPPGAYGLEDGETAIRTDNYGNEFRVTATRAAVMGKGKGRWGPRKKRSSPWA